MATSPITLRPLRTDDARRIAELAGDPEVSATTLRLPYPYELHHAEDWLHKLATQPEPAVERVWGIEAGDPIELVGVIGLTFNYSFKRAEVGYWIGRPYWNLGYATAALRAVINIGFGELGLNRIDAHHMAHNTGSGRVMSRAGMAYEGLLRQHVCKNDQFIDGLMYAILRQDWQDAAGRS